MITPGSANPLLFHAVDGSYQISRSLRFRSSASAYLSRTPASAGNRKTWTWSGWVKKGKDVADNTDITLFFAGATSAGQQFTYISFSTYSGSSINNGIRVASGIWGSSNDYDFSYPNVYRDYSGWYHIVVAYDSTQSTASNRIRIYVNGNQITSAPIGYAGRSTTTSPSYDTAVNNTVAHNISTATPGYFDGYIAENNFIDGYPTVSGTTYNATTWAALNVSTLFGAFDTNGVWQPIACTVSDYGKNGFYLPFSDSANIFNDKAAIATNHSAANNWTASGLQTTSSTLTTYDWMIDSPTNYADGGNGRGNYCVMNPLQLNKATLSNGNLTYVAGSGGTDNYICASTLGLSSGKFYWEVTVTSLTTYLGIGVASITNIGSLVINNSPVGAGSTSYCVYQDGSKGNNNTTSSYQTGGYATGNVVGVAFDIDNGKIWFSKNGTFPNSGDPAAGTNAAYTSIAANTFLPALSGQTATLDVNFGQRPFTYTPPSGFSALNTQNLPTPTIAAGNKYFNIITYTGTGASVARTGVGFQPDLVWYKSRSVTENHQLFDAVRGVQKSLYSNLTNAEATDPGVYSFDADGFTAYNSAYTYVAWNWKGGNGTSNIAVNAYGSTPSIASTVSANTSAGFSVVTWTSSGTTSTVGHGLGVAPSLIIAKRRDSTSNWPVYHASAGVGYLLLNSTAAYSGSDTSIWNGTAPTSTVLTTQVSSGFFVSGGTFVAYCFAPVSGYSAFGSYTGNASTDGPMIFTGFRPRYVMIKVTSTTGNWVIKDTSRIAYNANNLNLFSNLSVQETTEYPIDILSNGFKIRETLTDLNASGGTYIWAAFAETPFKFSRSR